MLPSSIFPRKFNFGNLNPLNSFFPALLSLDRSTKRDGCSKFTLRMVFNVNILNFSILTSEERALNLIFCEPCSGLINFTFKGRY